MCGCGNRGCAEVFAQAGMIARLGGRATAEAVFAGAADGDERCRDSVAALVRALAIAIVNVVTVLAPDVIVIGDGSSEVARRVRATHCTLRSLPPFAYERPWSLRTGSGS